MRTFNLLEKPAGCSNPFGQRKLRANYRRVPETLQSDECGRSAEKTRSLIILQALSDNGNTQRASFEP